jgi:tetratricopeptide (TPR) repeat protein
VVFAIQGMIHESLIAKYHAIRSVKDNLFRFRILGDLGISLRELGAYDAARQCFDMVIASQPSLIIRTNTCIELMEMESAMGNRLAFERYRQEARAFEDRMPPSMAIDYRYRIAIGFARFGKEAKARATLREALGLAEASKLNEWYFRIDRVLRNLVLCEEHAESTNSTADTTEVAPAVAEVSAGLKEFASGAFV